MDFPQAIAQKGFDERHAYIGGMFGWEALTTHRSYPSEFLLEYLQGWNIFCWTLKQKQPVSSHSGISKYIFFVLEHYFYLLSLGMYTALEGALGVLKTKTEAATVVTGCDKNNK